MTIYPTILVVDDEETIREVVRRYLEREGYLVNEAADGYEALRIIQNESPSLIVLDLMLPGIDGLSLTQHLRQDRQIPIIMLTAKSEDSDRIRGLDLGADDYITKPFNPQEVVSRVRAVLRRSNSATTSTKEKTIQTDMLSIDPVARNVKVNSQDIILTAKEFDLLWHFALHPEQVFTRAQLLAQVWGDELYTDPSTVTVHIRRLREKIEVDPSQPQQILTVWGVGYKFVGEK
ncbi:MAG: response regulator transcription factor [Anaerolineae bacterium]|jgi:DNA-binding response OmpR family regulator|nr:response regulator transcription factor [Anaerolineae bacterium]MBT7188957.1 response regulator transcription factor [Anaerolineae bacterium]MBT7991443.1 response regulator transcription factor [Anaerolineae bacterium]